MSLLPSLPTPNAAPVLSPAVSLGACSVLTLSYVGGLYLFPGTRVGRAVDPHGVPLNKDHPSVIRARLRAASTSTLLSLLGTAYLLRANGAVPRSGWLMETLSLSRLLGLPLPTPSVLTGSLTSPPLGRFLYTLLRAGLNPLLLTATLFLGPIYVAFLDGESPIHGLDRLRLIRNLVVGPATEEAVFRACVLATMFYGGASRTALVFASPLWFSLAHVHHAWGTYVAGGRTSTALKRGILQAALQATYTAVFGWYASFLFLRTGSLLGPTLSHALCNVYGLPNPAAAAEDHPERRSAIYLSHIAGVLGFAWGLWRWTRPELFGGSLYWQ